MLRNITKRVVNVLLRDITACYVLQRCVALPSVVQRNIVSRCTDLKEPKIIRPLFSVYLQRGSKNKRQNQYFFLPPKKCLILTYSPLKESQEITHTHTPPKKKRKHASCLRKPLLQKAARCYFIAKVHRKCTSFILSVESDGE